MCVFCALKPHCLLYGMKFCQYFSPKRPQAFSFSVLSEDEINIETAEPDPNIMEGNVEITEPQQGDLYPDSEHNNPALIAGEYF